MCETTHISCRLQLASNRWCATVETCPVPLWPTPDSSLPLKRITHHPTSSHPEPITIICHSQSPLVFLSFCLFGVIARKTDSVFCLLGVIARKTDSVFCLPGVIARKTDSVFLSFRSDRKKDGSPTLERLTPNRPGAKREEDIRTTSQCRVTKPFTRVYQNHLCFVSCFFLYELYLLRFLKTSGRRSVESPRHKNTHAHSNTKGTPTMSGGSICLKHIHMRTVVSTNTNMHSHTHTPLLTNKHTHTNTPSHTKHTTNPSKSNGSVRPKPKTHPCSRKSKVGADHHCDPLNEVGEIKPL